MLRSLRARQCLRKFLLPPLAKLILKTHEEIALAEGHSVSVERLSMPKWPGNKKKSSCQ